MLPLKVRYALKALAILVECGPDLITMSADISRREAIPRKFLEVILQELRQRGVLLAQRGRGGGYRLKKRPAEISLAEIIQALNVSLAPVPCLSRAGHPRCAECKGQRVCGVRLVLAELHEATARILDTTTLADLMLRTHQAAEHAPGYAN
jgi:Rrf2 family protein